MRGNLWRFFLGLAVWEAIVFLPIGIAVLRSGAPLHVEELTTFFLPIALCGIVIIVVCSLIASKTRAVASVLLGAFSGVVLMVGTGYLWAHVVRGFEESAGVFAGSVMLAIPSGIGSGIASWLLARRPPPSDLGFS